MEDDEEAFVIDNVASDRSTLIRMAADLPKGDEKRRAILAGLSKTALEVDKYVTIKIAPLGEQVEVAVVGIDSRQIQSWEGHLQDAALDDPSTDIDIQHHNPRGVPVPQHDPDTQNDPGWSTAGFSIWGDPEAIESAVKAIKKQAKKLRMKVYEGRGRWPKPPRVY